MKSRRAGRAGRTMRRMGLPAGRGDDVVEVVDGGDAVALFELDLAVAWKVDYACLPEDVQQHFQFCGTINRVTILTDSFGQPKGFAYVEFVEAEAVQNALLLNETELHGHPLKVSPKRTNIPGMKQSRGRHPFHPLFLLSSIRKVPRFRRSVGYNPYY